MEIKFQKIKQDAIIPTRANKGDAGFDLYCLENKILQPGQQYNFAIGLKSEIPKGYFVQINPKSGLAVKSGIDTLAGVIDSGFRGEWVVAVINFGQQDYEFKKWDKIAQGVLLPVPAVEIVEVDEVDSATQRGEGGFGSSGR